MEVSHNTPPSHTYLIYLFKVPFWAYPTTEPYVAQWVTFCRRHAVRQREGDLLLTEYVLLHYDLSALASETAITNKRDIAKDKLPSIVRTGLLVYLC